MKASDLFIKALENEGVIPDIRVENMPGDMVRGYDAQLTRAVDEVLKRLEEDPKEIPPRPPFPDKSKGGFRQQNR